MNALVWLAVAGAVARADDAEDIAKITSDNPAPQPTVKDVLAWERLDELMLGIAGDVAEVAVRVTVADVLATEEPESTVENGVTIYFTETIFWCGYTGVGGTFCYDKRANCLRKSKSCRSVRHVACVPVTAITTGESGALCRTTYGECMQTRAQAELSQEWTTGDCTVERYRKGRKEQ